VKVSIYNSIGERVINLKEEQMVAGDHTVEFNINETQGLSSGIYLYKVEFNSLNGEQFSANRKMLLLK
jgi:hypothetical protein